MPPQRHRGLIVFPMPLIHNDLWHQNKNHKHAKMENFHYIKGHKDKAIKLYDKDKTNCQT